MLFYRFFDIKCLHLTGNLRSGTVDGQIIQTLDNFIPRAPQISKLFFFFQGLRRVDKTNQTPQHDTSRTRSLTLTFGDGGCRPTPSSGFEYFVHLRYVFYCDTHFPVQNTSTSSTVHNSDQRIPCIVHGQGSKYSSVKTLPLRQGFEGCLNQPSGNTVTPEFQKNKHPPQKNKQWIAQVLTKYISKLKYRGFGTKTDFFG